MEFPEYSILSFPLAHDTYVRLVLESLKLHHCLEPFHRVRESERRPVPRLYYPARRSALWDFISFSFRRSRPFSVVSLAGSVPVSPCLVWHVKYDKYVRWTSRWETQLICKDLVSLQLWPWFHFWWNHFWNPSYTAELMISEFKRFGNATWQLFYFSSITPGCEFSERPWNTFMKVWD